MICTFYCHCSIDASDHRLTTICNCSFSPGDMKQCLATRTQQTTCSCNDIRGPESGLICAQGRNKVRWHTGQESSFAPPFSNLSSFGSKCTVLKKYLRYCWDFPAPPTVIRRPGNWTPLPPVTPRPLDWPTESFRWACDNTSIQCGCFFGANWRRSTLFYETQRACATQKKQDMNMYCGQGHAIWQC